MDSNEFDSALKSLSLSKKDFAELVGMNYNSVVNWNKTGIPSWVRPFLECQSKSKAYERVRDEVLSIEGVTVSGHL